MKPTIIIGWDEDGVWIAECPAIPSCISQGETREKAEANIQEAIAAKSVPRRS